MSTCFVLRHVPFESLGLLEPLLRARGLEIQIIDVPVTDLPKHQLQETELVVVLGGPIAAYEEHLYPFLTQELDLIERRLQQGKATLGICLGAQLMARALGAKVYAGSQREIGWSALQLVKHSGEHPLATLEHQSVLHWHGDTFDLPNDAELLASTSITPHQAFSWGKRAFALQFHLEVTARELEAWFVGHACELSQLGPRALAELRVASRTLAPALAPHALRALGGILDRVLSVTDGVIRN